MANYQRILVTGGAGFIGSHIVDGLLAKGSFVRVIDNLSSGKLENVKPWFGNERFEFIQGDLKEPRTCLEILRESETVFHLAANPEVRVAETDPSIHFNENLSTTYNILEAMRKNKKANMIVFFSSSTVYGEAKQFPTPEDYGPLLPISVYGASKLGCEALISAYCHTFGLRGLIFRLANVIGSRSTHGVILDFTNKLKNNPKELEILGDGNQRKSYLHIKDLIEAVSLALKSFLDSNENLQVYNLGSLDYVTVKRIAEIVAEEMKLQDVAFKFTGGVDGGRGWKGDVKTMLLSINKLSHLGWKPSLNSEDAVRLTCSELLRPR